MNRRLLSLLCTVVVMVALGASASAQNAQNFTIKDFTQVYSLEKNDQNVAMARVDEYITATFPDYDQNHGILRALPLYYDDIPLNTKIVSVDNLPYNAKPNTATESIPFSTYTQNNNMVLKIGNPDSFAHGDTMYHIVYTMTNTVRTYDGYDELFINVNGTQWPQTITSARSTIVLAPEITGAYIKSACYTGAYGSTTVDCQISTTKDDSGRMMIITNTTQPLYPKENLSVAVAFAKDTFTVVPLSFWDKYGLIVINSIFFVIPLVALWLLVSRWWRFGRDPKIGRSVIAQYEPPIDLDVLRSGILLKQTSTPTAISAQIIDLAIRGYITIIDTSSLEAKKPKASDFELVKQKDGNDLSDAQKMVMSMLFKDSNSVALSKLENKFYKDSQKLAGIIDTSMVADGLYRYQPMKQAAKYRNWGIALMIIGLFSLLITAARGVVGLNGAIVLVGVLLLVFAKAMPARTAKGAEANNYLLGLKLYIGMAEQDRIRFHQSAQGAERVTLNNTDKVHLYESLLPYAMLFGMEKTWSNEFKDIYSQPPDWYNSNHAIFNAVYFTTALTTFSQASGTMFTAPSSSGGSGFSSGGGFSGGGGGGGGGGGW